MEPLRWWVVGRIYPLLPGGDRVKVTENSGVTVVVPVAPVDTSLCIYLSLDTEDFDYDVVLWQNYHLLIK